jgi:predicted Rossmann fold flavoprotein
LPLDAAPIDVLIVGAGAAGLATAIFARRFNPLLRVVLLEGAKRPGAKILVSGGTRCNVTNASVTERDFWGGRSTVVRRVLRAFTAADAAAFFADIGAPLHEEAGGKLFPDSNRSRDVLDALLRESGSRGVILLSDHRVLDIARDGGAFRVVTSAGDYTAGSVVLASGGQSLPKTGSDGAGFAMARRLGHTIVETTPALAPLLLDGSASIHGQLSGVSQDVELAVWIEGAVALRLRGSLLWTHFGASGPVVLNASRHWLRATLEHRRAAITANFCPGESLEAVDARLVRAVAATPRAALQTMLASLVPASAAAAILSRLTLDGRTTLAHVSRDDRRRLARSLVEWPLPVTGSRGYTFAEATAGGVSLDEVDPSTLESRRCRGLFVVGEVLDVDGRIGGFNFQWAWSSGFVAGRAVAMGPRASTTS